MFQEATGHDAIVGLTCDSLYVRALMRIVYTFVTCTLWTVRMSIEHVSPVSDGQPEYIKSIQ